MVRKFLTLACAGVFAVAAASALAQNGDRPMKFVQFSRDGRPEKMLTPLVGLNAADRAMFKDAWTANQFELRTSQLAQQKGSSQFVREFAKEMITDHQAAQAELQEIAAKKGVNLPSSLPKDLQSKINSLSRANSAGFDDMYRKVQIQGHEATALKLKKYLRSGRDEDARAYAEKTLPTVELHLRHCMANRTAMGSTSADHGM